MPKQEKTTPQDDLRRMTILLVSIYLVTVIGMPLITLLAMGSINIYIWIAVGLMTVICAAVWWFYKRQVDAEIRDIEAKREERKNKSRR